MAARCGWAVIRASCNRDRRARRHNVEEVYERHRHRFEFNNAYREVLGKRECYSVACRRITGLVEIAELRDHPWMLGSQFHPDQIAPATPPPAFRALEARHAESTDELTVIVSSQ